MARRYERRVYRDPVYRDPAVMEEERIVHEDLAPDREIVETEYQGTYWSPAQPIALVFGVLFTVLGAVALARAGVGSFFDHVTVAGFHHTQILALIHLGAGLMYLMGAVTPYGARGMLGFIGAIALVFGIIVTIEPAAFHPTLATHQVHGVLYAVAGGLSLLFGMISPVFGGGYRFFRRWY